LRLELERGTAGLIALFAIVFLLYYFGLCGASAAAKDKKALP